MSYEAELTHRQPTVLTLRFKVIKGWEQWFLLSSDRHVDNVHSDHDLQRRHLDQARERNAIVLDFGDLFCAMQGKWDKRADQDQMRPELRTNRYLDDLESYLVDFIEPYADLFALISRGNHETGILRHHQTDLTSRLCARIKDRTDHAIVDGTYQGWVRLRFDIHRTQRQTLRLYYAHGAGAGGPVTKGVIQNNRQAAFLDNADIVCGGHTHDRWAVPWERHYLDKLGVPRMREMHFVRCGGYKDEFTPGEGWAVERGMPPKPKGAAWMRLHVDEGTQHGVQVEFVQAGPLQRRAV